MANEWILHILDCTRGTKTIQEQTFDSFQPSVRLFHANANWNVMRNRMDARVAKNLGEDYNWKATRIPTQNAANNFPSDSIKY